MATIYDVSVLAGVSLATVSRVMNKNTKVSEKTENKVLDAMKQLDYRPNAIAQSLASSRSNSIGVLVSELHGPFYGAMMSGIEAELRTAKKHVIIAAGHSDEESEKEGIEFLIDRRCDALILHVEAVSDEYLIELSQGSTPIVLINRYIAELKDSCIYLDNQLGGYLATKAMIESGHTALAYISGPFWKVDTQARLAGYKQALAESGLEFDPSLVYEGDYLETGGSRGFQALMKAERSFTALVCANDEMAAGAMDAARQLNVEIPSQVSIVGFDNIILANYIYPKLSTINYPIAEMGHMAARWVLRNTYKNKSLSIKNMFNPALILRDSISSL
ncbi:LacI family DNA-binding transcriptional regulator [Shewanella violacea]|uniref:Transcriptional regulator, LacI family n=1 Tax=Shewanella violacea (strain JCM 10179 / CIP 106290 / LMG 19151 / DSS12) TaxID=637905 RepID=D4ZIJ3_SHEVD|nr:LacI family DNA-binding transcriptional regulator [Shewanella violacea]BAJ01492.1 transcriptional regulator, LacI family [Shewanella violacea DSS12]